MKRTLIRVLQCCALLLATGLSGQSPELGVVVNKDNPVAHLTKAQVKKILTGLQTKWPNGEQVVVVMAPPGDTGRAEALRVFCGMTEQQFLSDQIHANFVGEQRTTPRIMPNSKSIVPVVELVPGAIGVVPSIALNNRVKVITID